MEKSSASLFRISEDHIEKYQSLDLRFIKNRASTFFFESEGDYMSPLILPGDILVVDRSIKASNQHIIVASMGSEMLCKRLIHRAGQIILKSENLKYPEIKIDSESDLTIFGVVRCTVREFI